MRRMRALVTAPSPAEQVQGLAAMSGTDPDPKSRRDVAMVAMIAESLRRGITWRQIGSVLGCDGPAAAKRAAKRLARSAQRAMLEQATVRGQVSEHAPCSPASGADSQRERAQDRH
jgi:hypothetical protein